MNNIRRNLESSAAKALFLGNILEENLFPYPQISTQESELLQMLIESIDKFMHAHEAQFRDYDRKGEQPQEFINSLKELGLFGLIIPEEYGGIGLSSSGYSRVMQQAARYDAACSLTLGAHSSIGMKGLLLFGTDEQKKRYLAKLACGEMIAAFCLTEPGAGSDAASVKTNAVHNPDGSWTLNGEKLWITNGPIAQFYTVFARTNGEHGKLTAFIVERSYEGVSTGHKEDKLGIRASATSTVSFANVHVPAENVLGGEGQGFKLAMAILNNGRTGIGGGCVGAMKRCIELAVKQSSERKQFGKSIAEFGMVQEKIAQMTVSCFAAESTVNMVAGLVDAGAKDYSVEAAMSKVFVTEALWTTVNEALQIAGGNGFMKDFPYEGLLRDSRINLIFEGTSEILRMYIGLSGLKDAGEYLKEIKNGASQIFNDPIKGFGVLSKFATKKVAQLTSLGRDRITSAHPALAKCLPLYEVYTSHFGHAVEALLMKYGKSVVEQQLHIKRIAEVAMDIFVGLSVLSRVTHLISQKGEAACADELRIAHVFTHQAKRRMNTNLRRLARNEDKEITEIAKSVAEKGGYKWDVL